MGWNIKCKHSFAPKECFLWKRPLHIKKENIKALHGVVHCVLYVRALKRSFWYSDWKRSCRMTSSILKNRAIRQNNVHCVSVCMCVFASEWAVYFRRGFPFFPLGTQGQIRARRLRTGLWADWKGASFLSFCLLVYHSIHLYQVWPTENIVPQH